jgi:hypothetical protein
MTALIHTPRKPRHLAVMASLQKRGQALADFWA